MEYMLKKINSAHIFHQFSYKIGIVNDNIIWLYGHIMRAQCKRHEDLNVQKNTSNDTSKWFGEQQTHHFMSNQIHLYEG